MKSFLVCLSLSLSSLSVFALPSFDPFADATASGGSSYTPGANLWGQTNANLERWFGVGTTNAGAPAVITNVALTMPAGLPASTGNSVKLVNQIGPSGRFNIGAHTTGILFYSLAIRVDDLGTLIAANTATHGGGAFNVGLNNSTGTDPGQQNTPTTFGATLYLGSSGGGYIFGIGRGTGSTSRFWESNAPHNVGDVVFVVASYEFMTGALNDNIRLWVNPNPSTFGAANYPTPDVFLDNTNIISADADLTTINSILLINRNAGAPAVMIVDELRLGTSWADVTGGSAPVVIPSLTVSTVDSNTVQLAWGTNAQGFSLQSVGQLLSASTPWAVLGGNPTISGTNYIQTDTISGAKFYRLSK